MLIETPKLLPENLEMLCYACEKMPATHLCRYQVDELVVQVCLCDFCMKIDTKRLLKNIIGIQGISNRPAVESITSEDPSAERSAYGRSWSIHL